MVGYLLDQAYHSKLNIQETNYYDVYIKEIAKQLGFPLLEIDLLVMDSSNLKKYLAANSLLALILGMQTSQILTDEQRLVLHDWVKAGGLLIGFGCQNLDQLFGIRNLDQWNYDPMGCQVSGFLELKEHAMTQDIHSPLAPEQKLLIFSPIQAVECKQAEELARLSQTSDRDLSWTGISWNTYGKGYAGYFAFDLAQTIWHIQQGKPFPKKPSNVPYLRTSDLLVTGAYSTEVLYAYELELVLQNMLAQVGVPFIYPIPPLEQELAIALFYWGGDGCGGIGSQDIVTASEYMSSRQLPYHINVFYEKGRLNLTKLDMQQLLENGHEVSLHYNFVEAVEEGITELSLKKQHDRFYADFAFHPECTVNHCGAWEGWHEPILWMKKIKGQADNSFNSNPLPINHPQANAPFFAFGFGTSFPYSLYGDFRDGNADFDFFEQPITCYELGHRGSIGDQDSLCEEELYKAVDFALHYNLALNMFYHALYIAHFPKCRDAIDRFLDYIKQKNEPVVHLGNDSLTRWWKQRNQARFSSFSICNDSIYFRFSHDFSGGMYIKIPNSSNQPKVFECNGIIQEGVSRTSFGHSWTYLWMPPGDNEVQVSG
jgi:hypothetical protein